MGTLLSRSLSPTETTTRVNFTPTLEEVDKTLAILSQRLPTELGIAIINAAAYWPRVRASDKSHRLIRASGGETVERIILLSPNVRGKAVGQARVCVDSRDQGESGRKAVLSEKQRTDMLRPGWSSFPQFHQTRQGSTSWFELGILRPIPNSLSSSNGIPDPATPLESPSLASNTFSYLTQIHSRLSSSDSMVSIAESQGSHSSEQTHSTTSKSQRERLQNYYLVGDRRHLLHYNVHAARAFVEHSNVFRSSRYPSSQSSHSSPLLDTATLQSFDTNLTDIDDGEEEEKENWVDEIQENDIVVIWALAKYAGWLNEIRGVSLELDLVVL